MNITDFEIKLIGQVKENPHIYNKRHVKYYNMNLRDKSWQQIAIRTNTNVTVCKKRWQALRARYRRLKTSNKECDSSNMLWVHMHFTEPGREEVVQPTTSASMNGLGGSRTGSSVYCSGARNSFDGSSTDDNVPLTQMIRKWQKDGPRNGYDKAGRNNHNNRGLYTYMSTSDPNVKAQIFMDVQSISNCNVDPRLLNNMQFFGDCHVNFVSVDKT